MWVRLVKNFIFFEWEAPYNEDSRTVPMKSKVSKVVKESDMVVGVGG